MTRILSLASALLMGSLLVGGPSAQADESDSESCLRTQIWDGYNDGWAVRTATSTTLGLSEYRIYLVTLYKGNEYRILACGDAQSSNIDVVLHDADGRVVAQDTGKDREPRVVYEPKSTSTFFVVVHARSLVDSDTRAGVSMAVTYR